MYVLYSAPRRRRRPPLQSRAAQDHSEYMMAWWWMGWNENWYYSCSQQDVVMRNTNWKSPPLFHPQRIPPRWQIIDNLFTLSGKSHTKFSMVNHRFHPQPDRRGKFNNLPSYIRFLCVHVNTSFLEIWDEWSERNGQIRDIPLKVPWDTGQLCHVFTGFLDPAIMHLSM